MKTEQERIDYLANKIREFNIVVSGGGEVHGGFGELPKDGPITLEHLEQAFDKFRLAGGNGIQAHGSLQNGYVLFGNPPTQGGSGFAPIQPIPSPPPPPQPPITGACCVDGVCSVTTSGDCIGTYMGDGSTCDSSIVCGCPCGFSAFDGSGRTFLRYTLVISGDVTRHERSDCPGSEFDTTEVYTCGGTYQQHYADDCTLVTDENSIVSHAAITGTGGGFDCTRADIECFCNSVDPHVMCSSMVIGCGSCSDGNSGTDTTDTTTTTRTRTVVFSQQCQNDFYCIPHNTHPAICTISGSYTATETLSEECIPI